MTIPKYISIELNTLELENGVHIPQNFTWNQKDFIWILMNEFVVWIQLNFFNFCLEIFSRVVCLKNAKIRFIQLGWKNRAIFCFL
jgi:hypothetical protein